MRIDKIASARPYAVILREKDLSSAEYRKLAVRVIDICRKRGVLCILHSFPEVAADLGAKAIHLPLRAVKSLSPEMKKNFSAIGASCHSAEDAISAEKLGCTYITAGHIFETDCKKGLPARGVGFLGEVCRCVSIPVYALGGINKSNFKSVVAAGAKGACVMSGAMECEDPETYLNGFKL